LSKNPNLWQVVMEKMETRIDWCIVRLGEDKNWWVNEISDNVNWDVDGLGIIDPKQFFHMNELLDSMTEYGLASEIVDEAFFTFEIGEELEGGRIKLRRVRDSLLKAEDMLFALPDVMHEDKGPYADFLTHISILRIKMLNDLIDFTEPFTLDEMEEVLAERHNNDYLEGRRTHFYIEVESILEFVPEGFALDHDIKDEDEEGNGEEDYSDLDTSVVDSGDKEEEKMLRKEDLKWEEEEREKEPTRYEDAAPDEVSPK
jgi:hypothetical protein